jgi:hypothetical protein
MVVPDDLWVVVQAALDAASRALSNVAMTEVVTMRRMVRPLVFERA